MSKSRAIIALVYETRGTLENIENMVMTGNYDNVYYMEWQGLTTEHKWSGNFIDFVRYIQRCRAGFKYYTYNLHILGTFLVKTFANLGYAYTNEKDLQPGEYTFFANEIGNWYSFSVCTKAEKKVHTLQDIQHLLPVDEDAIRASFAEPEDTKLEVLRKAIQYLKTAGLTTKMTLGANALSIAKQIAPFEILYPELTEEEDEFCRRAYNPGMMVNKPGRYGAGWDYDANNMYPYVLKTMPLPCGKPEEWDGKTPLEGKMYIARIRLTAKLIKGKMPILYKRDSKGGGQFVSHTKELEYFTLTSPELDELPNRYEIEELEIVRAFIFRHRTGVFARYVDHYYNMKKNAKSPAEKMVGKLMNNSLTGKFGQKPWSLSIQYDAETGKYYRVRTENKTVYIPMAAFITAYGRLYITGMAQRAKNPENIVYMDTDSIFSLEKLNIPMGGEIGLFKVEAKFDKLVIHSMKQYAYHNETGWNITAAGVPRGITRSRKNEFDASEEHFLKQFTYGFDIEAIGTKMIYGVYVNVETKYHIGGLTKAF